MDDPKKAKNMPSKDADSRFVQHDAVVITNDMLCCARCAHVWADKTAECGIFERKPLSVLRGGDCPDWEPRTEETAPISCRAVRDEEREVFSQYLLPDAARLLRTGQDVLLLGAVCGKVACGAAALRFPDPPPGADSVRDALLLSLFVDPLVRRRGVGTELLRLALDCARERGAARLRADYSGEEAEVAELDAFFRAFGAEPVSRLPIYEVDSGRFHDARRLKRAFSWDYRRPDHIVLFSELDETRRALLEQDPELPFYVDPARRLNMLPELSLAYLDGDGSVIGFWLGSASATDRYSVQGVWHNFRAPASCFHELLLAHVNLCYYRAGGDFLYYVSPVAEYADRLIQTYTGGDFRRLEDHRADILLDR